MRSTDGGDSATALNSGLSFSVGAPVAVNRIVLHPNYPATPQIWLGTVDAGIYFSANSGTTSSKNSIVTRTISTDCRNAMRRRKSCGTTSNAWAV